VPVRVVRIRVRVVVVRVMVVQVNVRRWRLRVVVRRVVGSGRVVERDGRVQRRVLGGVGVGNVVVRSSGGIHHRVAALAEWWVRQRNLVRAVVSVLRHLRRQQRHRAQLTLATALDMDHALAETRGLVDV
jgi:hypothetical protein